ncbi:MAG: hypothetical protein GXO75_16130 [Calditrichaeota bacterium]|nr:hypothetical protein [Calditrichota bacterium]
MKDIASDQVLEKILQLICAARSRGEKIVDIAEKTGVSAAHISNIYNRPDVFRPSSMIAEKIIQGLSDEIKVKD